MWKYEKKLQYPINIKNPNPKYAQIIISQYGGPDGELGASMRYLTQRYSQPFDEVKGMLTDIGTEELAHMEMVSAMVHQLTRNLTEKQIEESGFDKYFVDHTNAVFPVAAAGIPWRAEYIQAKGDILADLHEDLAAEQKARVTYDNLLRLIDDPDVLDPLKFLRQREVVHYQRFGEAQQTKWNDNGGAVYKPHEIMLLKHNSLHISFKANRILSQTPLQLNFSCKGVLPPNYRPVRLCVHAYREHQFYQ